MQQLSDLVGQIVGHYRILQPLDSGGMATVYQAEDIHLHRQVAIKVFRPESEKTSAFLRHFVREAQVLANLDHPHILLVHDYGEQDGLAYLVMPLMTQGSLKSRLQAQQSFPVAEALRMAEQILGALQYAQEYGLIHRDIKPANILFKSDGTLLLSDFGLVKIQSATNEQAADIPTLVANTKDPGASSLAFAGTPAYMAPEQIQGQAIPQSDIYSVGVMLYELLTGRCPFYANNALDILMQHLTQTPRPLRELNPNIPPRLEAAVMQALEKDPQRRYQSASDFLRTLSAISAELNLQNVDTVRRENGAQSPLAQAGRTNADPFKTQWMADSQPAKQLQISTPYPALLARRERRRWSPYRIGLLTLLMLLIASGSLGVWVYQNHNTPTSSNPPLNHGASRTGTPSATTTRTLTPQASRLASTTAPQTNCPKDDAHANPVAMPSLSSQANHQNLVYLTSSYDKNYHELSTFRDYDISARQSRDILKLPAGSHVYDAQISGDGQWVLFLADYPNSTASQVITKIQMVRIADQRLETLYCTTKSVRGVLWSPDMGTVVFNLLSPTGVIGQSTPLKMYMLDTARGELSLILKATVGTGYTPLIWFNHGDGPYSSFYATNYMPGNAGGPLVALPGTLYAFDLTQGPPYPSPVLIAKTNGCQTYTLSPDNTRLFISQCNPASGPQSPSTIQAQDISNPQHPSSPRIILNSSTLSIFDITAVSNTTLLLDVLNEGGDSSQNGIWQMNMDGTGLKMLTTGGSLDLDNLASAAYQDLWTNVSRNGQFYSVSNWQGNRLAYGPLNGKESEIIPIPLSADIVGVIGWAII